MALLEIDRVSKTYPGRSNALGMPGEPKLVVDDVSLSIERGETVGLVGESGSGKSTVARMALGLIEPSAGAVRFAGETITGARGRTMRRLRRRIQPVFQDPYAALNPRMRVLEIITEPLWIHKRDPELPDDLPRTRAAVTDHAASLLRHVGLDAAALTRYPHEFSGGQRQRINIARALALRPELLILDEPVSALDVSVGAQIVNLLRDLQREHALSYLFITHSMPLVRYLANRIAVMRNGKLVEEGDAEELCRAPRDPYTQALLAATPTLVYV